MGTLGSIIDKKSTEMKKYKSFTKSQFEFYLIQNKSKIAHLKGWREISDEISEDIQINEYVYEYKTTNSVGFVMVFSSIGKDDGKAREKGEDAVRLVYRWNIKGCSKYHAIATKYRVKRFFTNFKEVLGNTEKDIVFGGFGKMKSWVDKLEEVEWKKR